MKKTIIVAGLVIAALAVFSCEKVNENQLVSPEKETPAEKQFGETVFTLSATAPEAENNASAPASAPSKTSLSGLVVSWTAGDQIVVNGVPSKPLAAGSIKPNGSADFEFDAVLTAPYQAVYPASAYVDGTWTNVSDTLDVVFPATQAYVAGSFDSSAAVMMGTGTDGVSFSHAAAYLKLTFDQNVKLVRVMANDGRRVRGRMTANFGTSALQNYYTASNYNTVTVSYPGGIAAGDPVIIAIPPKNYSEGLNILAVTSDDKYQILRTGPADLSTKAGVLCTKDASLNDLDTWEGPGIYCETDWRSFVCADESKFTTDDSQREDASAWKGDDGEINIYKDFTVATNLLRHGSNFGGLPGASNNIYFLETLDGNNHTLTQNATTVPLIAWLGSNTETGIVKNLTLAGECTSFGDAGWGPAAFAIRVLKGGVLDHCVNKINTTLTETEPSTVAYYIGGLASSNAGLMTDCTNEGNITITLVSAANRSFDMGGFAASNRYPITDGYCGDFTNCTNTGDLTVIKKASGSDPQCLYQCGIGGICATIVQGIPGSDPTVTKFTGIYTRFTNCTNEGNITFWEEKSGTSSGNQLAIGIGGILGICTKYSSSCPYVGANDQGFFFVIDGGHNTGTIDVSSANYIQPLKDGMTGARETYIGGLVGFVMGSNNSEAANSSTYYPVIRGSNNNIIKLGSEAGCEAAGGFIGGGGFFKLDNLSASSVEFQESTVDAGVAGFSRAPSKVGGVSPLVGWVVKRSLAVPTADVTLRMDASGLSGLTVYGQGVGVTSNATKNAAGGTDGTNKAPLLIFESAKVGDVYQHFEFALKYADGSTEPAASLAAGYQAASSTFYGKATTSGSYLRKAGNLQFVAWS